MTPSAEFDLRRAARATRLAFLVAGLAVAAWAPLVPLVKARLGLDEGRLGGLLLCVGLGSIVAMPFSGGLAGRLGLRRVILASAIVALAVLPVLATGATVPVLAAALAVFGASVGTLDATMNMQAVVVERAAGRAMMSGFHGLFSVGAIIGAAGVSGILGFGATPLIAVLVVAASAGTLLISAGPGFLREASAEPTPAFAKPRGRVLLLGALCFVLFLAEGSVLDWSAVLLSEVHRLGKAMAGLGFVAFSTTMTLGRLFGDRVVVRLGPRRIVGLGGTLAAAGFALAALAPAWPLSVAGFGLVGLGAANVVPVLFTAAGRQRAMPPGMAIAAVTTLGYAGHLAGPALVGFAARNLGLPSALSGIALLLVGAALCARPATSSPE